MKAGEPACFEECGGRLQRRFADMGIEAHVTAVPPLVPSRYDQLDMTCPHGVLWFTEPTTDQVAQWAKDGVR